MRGRLNEARVSLDLNEATETKLGPKRGRRFRSSRLRYRPALRLYYVVVAIEVIGGRPDPEPAHAGIGNHDLHRVTKAQDALPTHSNGKLVREWDGDLESRYAIPIGANRLPIARELDFARAHG